MISRTPLVEKSDVGVGAVLLQDSEDGVFHPVAYISQKFKGHQRPYNTVEKELLALIMALEKWDVYFEHNTPLIVYSDRLGT
ncbi:hypothetical protein Pmani_003944 [Petrolisthes manimaculis]|uniref:Reverse transcriptase RNase H-like domain-containing protein n=1 Tax=Petrolisthes manimaculis TaxID=1843537 RepID=A0AAE1QEP5_9EUCA|nr:hypothetical protein Pmani_003944 [Petrolisthes manimaculis]